MQGTQHGVDIPVLGLQIDCLWMDPVSVHLVSERQAARMSTAVEIGLVVVVWPSDSDAWQKFSLPVNGVDERFRESTQESCTQIHARVTLMTSV